MKTPGHGPSIRHSLRLTSPQNQPINNKKTPTDNNEKKREYCQGENVSLMKQ